jgi:hypothetical protein
VGATPGLRLSRRPELLGIHTIWVSAFPPEVDKAIPTGGPLPSDLSAANPRAVKQLRAAYEHAAYAAQLGTPPQTMYGLDDSPIGLAAYLLTTTQRATPD